MNDEIRYVTIPCVIADGELHYDHSRIGFGTDLSESELSWIEEADITETMVGSLKVDLLVLVEWHGGEDDAYPTFDVRGLEVREDI